MKKKSKELLIMVTFLSMAAISFAQNNLFVVDADHPAAKIQPTLWGLFFEDINFAADGGIYAELVKNRSFEFPKPLDGWKVESANIMNSPVLILNRNEESANNPRIAQVTVKGKVCITNSGFRGMGLVQDHRYRFSVLSSITKGDVKIHVQLMGHDGIEIGTAMVSPSTGKFQKFEAIISAAKTDAKAVLKICFEGEGTIQIDMVSLFPVDTWKNRPNGLRADLVQKLADLKPGFIRFPGGCIVEGRDLAKRYQWKNTIGNVEDRKLIVNRWNDENDRATPDYFQSFGLGFFEYFLLAEDIGAEPVPILNCGMACQFNTGEVVSMEELDPFIQDALDLIEFANGDTGTVWGKVRTEMGHPKPFHLKFLGIGNEQWGVQYFERYAAFEKTIRAKFPDIQLISSFGPMPSGPMYKLAEEELKKLSPALVDEHYYNSTNWFFDNATRYDAFDRNSFKIFAGEYAARNGMPGGKNEIKSTWEAALSEAAFMTGIERNADVVSMASYAPLLANTEAFQWSPNLIWFDNLRIFGTPSYYVQQLYSTNKGTDVLRILHDGIQVTGNGGFYATAAWDENSKEIILKIVNRNPESTTINIRLNSHKKLPPAASRFTLQSDDLMASNSLEKPENIVPVKDVVKLAGKTFPVTLKPYSLTVLRIKQ